MKANTVAVFARIICEALAQKTQDSALFPYISEDNLLSSKMYGNQTYGWKVDSHISKVGPRSHFTFRWTVVGRICLFIESVPSFILSIALMYRDSARDDRHDPDL